MQKEWRDWHDEVPWRQHSPSSWRRRSVNRNQGLDENILDMVEAATSAAVSAAVKAAVEAASDKAVVARPRPSQAPSVCPSQAPSLAIKDIERDEAPLQPPPGQFTIPARLRAKSRSRCVEGAENKQVGVEVQEYTKGKKENKKKKGQLKLPEDGVRAEALLEVPSFPKLSYLGGHATVWHDLVSEDGGGEDEAQVLEANTVVTFKWEQVKASRRLDSDVVIGVIKNKGVKEEKGEQQLQEQELCKVPIGNVGEVFESSRQRASASGASGGSVGDFLKQLGHEEVSKLILEAGAGVTVEEFIHWASASFTAGSLASMG
ncbi:unnamed protein product [Prorocentrum cordatum]|uniref:Uncharacterized protein n=1 Tax=Prorocentrum cordatum TaxID=2364126 RepID=A0ABN9RQ15_9DINO|nr:unnamed protein product [Polarella glacialis]